MTADTASVSSLSGTAAFSSFGVSSMGFPSLGAVARGAIEGVKDDAF